MTLGHVVQICVMLVDVQLVCLAAAVTFGCATFQLYGVMIGLLSTFHATIDGC